MHPALSGTAAAAYRWSDHGQNYNSTHCWGARHVSCGYALVYRVSLAHVLHYSESFTLLYPADRLTTDPPVLILQQDRELPIPKTRIALRQPMGTCYQLAPFLRVWLPAFGTAVQGQHATRSLLTHTVGLLRIHRCAALDSQAYQFFPSTSFSIRLSRVSSPMRRFNSAFSRWSARRRFALEISMPANCHRY